MVPIPENPYQAPQTFEAPPDHPSDAEVIRKEHLNTEASIKSLGFLHYLISLGIIRLSISFLSQYEGKSHYGGVAEVAGALAEPLIGAVLLGFAIFQFFTGSAIRKLKPWGRIAAIILSGIGLLAFPVGTLINAYILYVLIARKGKMVFSARYKEIIAATPHVKYRTSKTVWVVLGVLIVILTIIIAYGMSV